MQAVNRHALNLVELFHTHVPPELSTRQGELDGGGTSSRVPGPVLANIFSGLPGQTLKVSLSHDIIRSLQRLLEESWSERAREPVGSTWDAYLAMDEMTSADMIHGEVVDLNAVVNSCLFRPVNLIASQAQRYLKPEAYPKKGLRAHWGRSVRARGLAGADTAACLSREGQSLAAEEDKVPMERKNPDSVRMMPVLNGLRIADRSEGFTITLEEEGAYSTHEWLDVGFRDSILQTFEYMDQSRLGVGLSTDYNLYIVVQRLAQDHIALSQPVIRDSSLRENLEDTFANDMSAWDLLLALLIYGSHPESITGWPELWVRTADEGKVLGKRRPGGSSSPKKKNKKGGKQSEMEERATETGRGNESTGGPSGSITSWGRGRSGYNRLGSGRGQDASEHASYRLTSEYDRDPTHARHPSVGSGSGSASASDSPYSSSNADNNIITPDSAMALYDDSITVYYPSTPDHPGPPSPLVRIDIGDPSAEIYPSSNPDLHSDGISKAFRSMADDVPGGRAVKSGSVCMDDDESLTFSEGSLTLPPGIVDLLDSLHFHPCPIHPNDDWLDRKGIPGDDLCDDRAEDIRYEAHIPHDAAVTTHTPFITSPVHSLSPRVILHDLIARGRYFTTYSGTFIPNLSSFPSPSPFPSSPSPPLAVFLKLACSSTPRHHKELGLPPGEEVIAALMNELDILNGPLRDLQGDIVPVSYGLWTSRAIGDVWAISMMERVGGRCLEIRPYTRVHERSQVELSEDDKGTIRQAYSMIHSRKVVHNDIQPRHVLLEPAASEHVAAAEGQRKRVRIIDFDRAKAEGRENEARGDDRGRVKIGTMIEWERRMLDLMLNRCAEA